MARVRQLLIASSVLLVSLPAAVLLTFLTMPLWSWLGARWDLAAVGPSGPALWCYAVVYGLLAVLAALVMVIRWR